MFRDILLRGLYPDDPDNRRANGENEKPPGDYERNPMRYRIGERRIFPMSFPCRAKNRTNSRRTQCECSREGFHRLFRYFRWRETWFSSWFRTGRSTPTGVVSAKGRERKREMCNVENQ